MKLKLLLTLSVFSLLSIHVYAQDIVRDSLTTVNCGDIVESEFVSNFQEQNFSIALDAGTSLHVTARPLGSGLLMTSYLVGPTNLVVAVDTSSDSQSFDANEIHELGITERPEFQTEPLGSRGTHTIRVINFQLYFDGEYRAGDRDIYAWIRDDDSGGIGVYTLYIGCTLRDGTVIEAGANLAEQGSDNAIDNQETEPPFSGFGFPGLPPIDFSNGIEIPLQAGQIQTIPLGGDVALYTYDAIAEELRTLAITRVNGDISIGITVIKRDTNEIIFLGGMPSSDNLVVELNFPSDGSYTIGLFRLDTPQRSGTSGAVQLRID